MKLLREISDKNIGINKTYETELSYKVRKAARAIIFNELNEIAILNVTKGKYHKLPGGGIEKGEDIITALRRESIEEVGVEINVLGEVGVIIEYRNEFNLLHISYCYIAKTVGEVKETAFTDREKEDGFELEWMSFDETVKALEGDNPESYVGKFIRERDLAFLEEFLKHK